MASFTQSAFVCVAVLSCIILAVRAHGNDLNFHTGICPMGWVQYNQRCFQYVARRRSWPNAELHCLSLGGNLASVHNAKEDFLFKVMQMKAGGMRPFWIGLSDKQKEGKWMWSDGTKLDFFKWNFGEPNNIRGKEDCVNSNNGVGRDWNDSPCFDRHAFICSLRLPCCQTCTHF